MVKSSVPAVLLDRHVLPGPIDFVQVDLHQHHAWLLPSTVTQHFPPGVDGQGVAVGRTLLVVPAYLRCCQDKALRFYCPGTE